MRLRDGGSQMGVRWLERCEEIRRVGGRGWSLCRVGLGEIQIDEQIEFSAHNAPKVDAKSMQMFQNVLMIVMNYIDIDFGILD